jgi:hypothetical protein
MRSLLALLIVLTSSGCAAILGTKQKDFNLRSDPGGADVYLNGNRLGATPLRVKLSNQATHVFVFRRQGFREATCTLNRGTDAGWVILDVLTGLVPIVIDAATNSWSQTKGDECSQALEPLTAAARTSTEAVPAPAQAAPSAEPSARPRLVDDVPSGANWVADSRTRTYYRVGCPITANISQGDRLFYVNDSTLQVVGYKKSEDCDLTGPTPQARAPAPAPATPAPAPALAETSSQETARSRSGFWFTGGLGYGSLGCDGCSGREGSYSGGLALGGTVSQKVVLGVGTNGWYESENGVELTVGTLTALIRFYPSSTGGFFLLGGLGVGSIRVDVAGFGSNTETGGGALLGLGYDLRVGRNVSITPFWNGFAVKTSNDDANVGQIGLGLTVH